MATTTEADALKQGDNLYRQPNKRSAILVQRTTTERSHQKWHEQDF